MLTSLDGFELEYPLIFDFKATNNEIEYEALLAGLSISAMLGANRVVVKCDS